MRSEQILKKIQEMSEADFTLQVLVPLFSKLGYRVDYNGGPLEGGKDMICWKNGDFAAELTVIQVKRTTASAAAGSSNAFSGIVNQLQQAAEKSVPNLQGFVQKPNGIYFITPYEIDTRALESRFEGMLELNRRNVRVLDGRMVVEKLIDLLPEVADALCGESFVIREEALTNLSNSDLLSALNYQKDKNISNFYCDLDFGVGKITTKSFFSLQFSPLTLDLHLNKSQWSAFRSTLLNLQRVLSVSITTPTVALVETEYGKQYEKWASPSNRVVLDRISSKSTEIASLCESILDSCGQVIGEADAIEVPFGAKIVTLNYDKLPILNKEEQAALAGLKVENEKLAHEFDEWRTLRQYSSISLEQLEALVPSIEGHLSQLVEFSKTLKHKKVKSFGLLGNISKNARSLPRLVSDLKKYFASRVIEPTFDVTVLGEDIVNALTQQRAWVAEGLEHLSSRTWGKTEIREFFLRCQALYTAVGEVLSQKYLSEAVGPSQAVGLLAKSVQRISMPIREVFATGINCAVFGEAGAGKSTTLFKYASSANDWEAESELTLYLPLTRVLTGILSGKDDETLSPLRKLENGMVDFLKMKGKYSPEQVINFLKSRRRLTLIFDGVDEVIKTAPWVVNAIGDIEAAYTNSQIILSSRTSGSYVDAIKYLGLTLLPFSDSQVSTFVDGWFSSDSAMAAQVKDHLAATPALREIVRNPLAATVLCVLAEHRVPLPASELGMYEERFNLLLGHYDVHKKTRRLESHRSVLEAAARSLALFLHSKNLRSAPPSVLEDACVDAIEGQFEGISSRQLRVAVRELIDPCNILEPMTDDGDFGFGHLRYQEYLCAKELCANRGIDLLPLLSSSWWRSVMVLFARMTKNIRNVVSEVIDRQKKIVQVEESLMAMVLTRPEPERSYLTSMIAKHRLLDVQNDELKSFYDFDNDDDGYQEKYVYREPW